MREALTKEGHVNFSTKKSGESFALAAPPTVCAPLINPSRGHASRTNDARTREDPGDIASPSRSAGRHNRSSLCSDAHDTRVGRYQPQNRVLQHRPLASDENEPLTSTLNVFSFLLS